MSKRKYPSFGRAKAVRGLDQFDSPPAALEPLFANEPLLVGVKAICEPFCGKGNLVVPIRARGIMVHASDIQYRGCPDSTVCDFLQMTACPPDCDVLLSNCPYDGIAGNALQCIEHAFEIGFRLLILLLKTRFLNGEKRRKQLYARGHLRRIYPFDGRLQDMHDANFKGEKASQGEDHGWFVFDRNYFGSAEVIPVSLKDPTALLPWQNAPRCASCGRIMRPKRSTARFCSDTCRQRAHRLKRDVSVTEAVSKEAAE